MANHYGSTSTNFQSQYNSLSQQLNQMEQSGMQDTSMYRTMRSQRDQLVPQMGSDATASGAATTNQAQQNFQSALDMTRGRGDAVMSDPYTQAALDRFKGVLGGHDVPYTDQVQNQLLARQADAGSAAAGAQGQMLRDSMTALGGSMSDPQAQAAIRQIQAQLGSQNNANLGDMQSKATLANFGAKNYAASSLAATRGSQLGMANSQYNQAGQLYANQQLAGPHQSGMAQYATPTYGNQQAGGQGSAPQMTAIDMANADLNRDPRYAQAPYRPATPPRPTQQPQTYLPNMSYGSNNWTTGQANGAPIPARVPASTYNPNLPVY
jgi:hypothetical protein